MKKMRYETKDVLKIERMGRCWTQQQVADILKIQRATYAQYERGQSVPPAETLKRLSLLFNISTDEILFGMSFQEMNRRASKQGMERGDKAAEAFLNKMREMTENEETKGTLPQT